MRAHNKLPKSLHLDPAAFIQGGGEGDVYAHNGKALKLYHHPQPQRSAKLAAFHAAGLRHTLPPNVLAPQHLHYDAGGMVIAFEMPLLPTTAQPMKKLSQPLFARQQGITLATELDLLLRLCHDLDAIHRSGMVVGDLNDHNIYFDLLATAASASYWLDVDSFQFGGFPCPVALQYFLDPHLYRVADLAAKAVFTRQSDWYAFAVLLCKTLLKTHPFGGVHHQLKTIQARAEAGISVFHPDVLYPKSARLAQILDDALLGYFRRTFEQGHREPPPAQQLAALRRNLAHCPACAQSYSAARPVCPTCRRQAQPVVPAHQPTSWRLQRLLTTEGLITALFVSASARITAIVREANDYRLLRLDEDGGCAELPLFTGAPGARFGLFQECLVINPAARDDLLVVDVGGATPRLLEKLNSERAGSETVFAATPQALYRVAGNYLLRGELRRGCYLEEIIASAHRRHTQLWASPHADRVAGLHSPFGEAEFFLVDENGRQLLVGPATLASGRPRRILNANVAWDRRRLAFLWHEKAAGNVAHHLQIVSMHGETLHQAVIAHTVPPFDRLDGRLLYDLSLLLPDDGGILKIQPHQQALHDGLDAAGIDAATTMLHWHERGLLVQGPHSVYLVATH